MIEHVNDATERTYRVTGMPREEIVWRGLICKEIPRCGIASATRHGWSRRAGRLSPVAGRACVLLLHQQATQFAVAVPDVIQLAQDHPLLGAAFARVAQPLVELQDDVFQFDLVDGLGDVGRVDRVHGSDRPRFN